MEVMTTDNGAALDTLEMWRELSAARGVSIRSLPNVSAPGCPIVATPLNRPFMLKISPVYFICPLHICEALTALEPITHGLPVARFVEFQF